MTPSLNRQLVLEEEVREADDSGGYSATWQALGTLWGQVLPASTSYVMRGGMSVQRQCLQILVRNAPVGSSSRPKHGQRLREGARVFFIESVVETDASMRFLSCAAFEEMTA